ncbi:unnamed protein product [Rhizophagus irregularis]|nr:unnamed protein product [Rhizophagus irregularis]
MQALLNKSVHEFDVVRLYGLGESDDPSLSVFPPFTCEYKELNDDSSQEILRNLITELNARLKTIPISGNEVSKSQYRITELEAENAQNMELEWRAERTLSEKFRRDGVVFEPINEVEKLRHGIDELSYTVLSK